jgi:hypothetical protein
MERPLLPLELRGKRSLKLEKLIFFQAPCPPCLRASSSPVLAAEVPDRGA